MRKSHPVRPLPIEAPTDDQRLGYRKAHLHQLMKEAGTLTAKATLTILKMGAEDVERQIEYYQKKNNQTSKAA